MGFWSELGKAAASGLLSEMESSAKKLSKMTNDPQKAARRLRREYFDG